MRILLAGNRIVLRQLGNIRSRNERLLARAGKNDDTNRRVILDVMKRRPQLLHGGHVQRVQNLRPVDGDVGNRVFLFEENVFEVHKRVIQWLSRQASSPSRSDAADSEAIWAS